MPSEREVATRMRDREVTHASDVFRSRGSRILAIERIAIAVAEAIRDSPWRTEGTVEASGQRQGDHVEFL
jgi:hypothetical protein